MRGLSFFEFKFLEGLEPLFLIFTLGLVVGKHTVKVKGDAKRLVIFISIQHLTRKNKSSREASFNGMCHVLGIGRQK